MPERRRAAKHLLSCAWSEARQGRPGSTRTGISVPVPHRAPYLHERALGPQLAGGSTGWRAGSRRLVASCDCESLRATESAVGRHSSYQATEVAGRDAGHGPGGEGEGRVLDKVRRLYTHSSTPGSQSLTPYLGRAAARHGLAQSPLDISLASPEPNSRAGPADDD